MATKRHLSRRQKITGAWGEAHCGERDAALGREGLDFISGP